MGKIAMVAAAATGYVLGARAGRERYEQIRERAQSVWSDPRVQEGAAQARGVAREKGAAVSEKVSGGTGGPAGSTAPGSTRG